MSQWIDHVKQYQQQHGVTYKEALQQAKVTYGGGAEKINYIKNLIYSDNFDPSKIKSKKDRKRIVADRASNPERQAAAFEQSKIKLKKMEKTTGFQNIFRK